MPPAPGRAEVLADLIAPAVDTAPQRPAVIDDGGVLTFAEFEARSAALAGWLAARTAPGDRIAVVADNSIDYALAYYAAPRARRVLALINQRLDPAERAAQIDLCRPALVLGDSGYPSDPGQLAFGGPEWAQALAHPRYDGEPARPEDPAWLVFTSGSTGRPKAAVHTHRSLTAAVWGTVAGRAVPDADVYLTPFPMCHIAGYNVLVRHATGSTVVLPARFVPEQFVATVNTHRVRACSLAPTMLHALVGHVERTGARMPTLTEVAYGSAPITAELIDRATRVLGVDFHQGYGMTETGGNVTFLTPAEHRMGPQVLRTAGRPHAGVQIGIAGEAGATEPGPPGSVGEILIRGEQVMSGYWDPVAGAAAGVGDWLRTGDVGRIDDDGRLVVVDRSKDIVITGGENVSSREVEDVLATHPGVDMVAVVGVPDPYWGEAICAVVVPRADCVPTAEELINHVRQRISPFKRPRRVVFVEQLPMTGNGKIAKDKVRHIARAATLEPD